LLWVSLSVVRVGVETGGFASTPPLTAFRSTADHPSVASIPPGAEGGAMKLLLVLVASVLTLAVAPATAQVRSSEPVPAGTAVWPLDPPPTVVAGFDPPTAPWAAGHRGVDLLGLPGQPARAALAGTISFAGSIAGRGVVVVDHGSMRTTYEPVDPAVAVGATVATGEVIGTLQAGLSHCFPRTCLHWGLLLGELYLDPLTLIGWAPVRLLPLALPVVMPWGVPAGRPFAVAPR
jgi:murein DD-endopeptidase MepM/ murein hydrolase activator NlpD